MKKQYSVKLIVILVLLLCACKTTDNSSLIRDVMIQAQQQADSGNYENAVKICSEGYLKTNDYRLLYNQSIYSALSGSFSDAVSCCDLGIQNHSTYYTLFSNAKMDYLKQAGNREDLYNYALFLWTDKNNTSKEILDILYGYNPEEWGVLYKALYPSAIEQ